MPSFVIAGASRGLGYAWLEFLSKDSNNIVIGTARRAGPTIEQVKKDRLQNVTILEADLVDPSSLQRAAQEVAKRTGGSVDYLIVNGAYVSQTSAGRFLDEFESEPEVLQKDLDTSWSTNVVGTINCINAFLPLIKKSQIKKVIVISTGMADTDLIVKYDLWEAAPYSISKAAVNVVVAKYAARYSKSDGVLFLSLSPGVVATGDADATLPPEMPGKFARYAPHFTGPLTPADSVEAQWKVIQSKSVDNGDSGDFVSHMGTKQWL